MDSSSAEGHPLKKAENNKDGSVNAEPSLLFLRQRHIHDRPGPIRSANCDCPAMQSYDFLNDRQPQAIALSGMGGIRLVKFIKNMRLCCGGNFIALVRK